MSPGGLSLLPVDWTFAKGARPRKGAFRPIGGMGDGNTMGWQWVDSGLAPGSQWGDDTGVTQG